MSEPEAQIVIRRLSADEAQEFSDLLRGFTAESPVPTGLSLEDEFTRTLESFKSQLSQLLQSVIVDGFVAGELAAAAALSRMGSFTSLQIQLPK